MLLFSKYFFSYKKTNKFLIYSKTNLIFGTIFNYFIVVANKNIINKFKKKFFFNKKKYTWDYVYSLKKKTRINNFIKYYLIINFFYFFYFLLISGIGWRFFKKIILSTYKNNYILMKLGYSFQTKFIIPKYFSIIKKGLYTIKLGFFNLKILNIYLNNLLKLKPTFKFKDIGLRKKKKKPTIKKWNRNINKKK